MKIYKRVKKFKTGLQLIICQVLSELQLLEAM